MNNYLLYEIGVEEMPSRFVQSTLDQLVSGLKSRLEEKRVAFEDIDTFATPRRLILVVKGLADRQDERD